MGKYLLFHRHHVVKLLLWIGMECGDIHYVIECASCCSQCCFQVFKSKLTIYRAFQRYGIAIVSRDYTATVNQLTGYPKKETLYSFTRLYTTKRMKLSFIPLIK